MDVYNNLFTFRPAPVNRLAARSFSNAGRPAVISRPAARATIPCRSRFQWLCACGHPAIPAIPGDSACHVRADLCVRPLSPNAPSP